MIQHFTQDIIPDLVAFQVVVLMILLGNVYVLWRAGRHGLPSKLPTVSVLVPARDEQAGIEACVRSLLAQDYPGIEVLVLDDGSTDATWTILTDIAGRELRLSILPGKPLPEGWLGKNWACAQLAAHASGDLLLFTDADTTHAPQAVRAAVSAMEGEQADLITGFPRQEIGTWGEKLIVPFFSWALYCFVPLALAYRFRIPAMAAAIGQVMLFRREAYAAVGGHGSVRGSIAEDLSLARRVVRRGYRWRMFNVTPYVSCRMYRSGREAVAGLSKNLFAAFGFRIVPYLFAWTWLLLVFVLPLVYLAVYSIGLVAEAPIALGLVNVVLSLMLWAIPFHRLRVPLYLASAYPISLLVVAWVALRSLCLTVGGRLVWKGRSIGRPRLRLI